MLTDNEIHCIAAGESAMRVIREHRGLTLMQLGHENFRDCAEQLRHVPEGD